MLRCFSVRIPFALFAFALVVRAAVFGLHPDAAYSDSYYYVDVARALHAGHGFNIDFIYSFLDVGGRLPSDPHGGVAKPDWIGAPVFTVPYTGPRTGDPVVDAAPPLGVYPVCTTVVDTRCGVAP